MIQFTDDIGYGEGAIVTDGNEVRSFAEVQHLVDSWKGRFDQPALACILCRNSLGALSAYLACLQSRIPAILLDAAKSITAYSDLFESYKPRYVFLPKDTETRLGEAVSDVEDYKLIVTGNEGYPMHPDLALLLTTSGSTGSPKLVRLSRANLQSNAASIITYLGIGHNERPITSLPMHYSYGLSVINSHLAAGATILLTDRSVLQREFWNMASTHRATSMAGVPYTYEMLRRLKVFRMDLPWLRTFTQAGGRLNPTIVKEMVEQASASGKDFIVMYGQTEATARISHTPREFALSKYTSIGVAIPYGKLWLCDATGKVIETDNTEGELIYQGPNVSLGYAECAEDLAKGDENQGILHTGDLAYRDSDGFYYITGRLKRFVKIWGNRCSLDSIEELAKSAVADSIDNGASNIAAVDSAAVGVDDLITVFITYPGIEGRVKSLLAEKTGFNTRAFAVKYIETIPKNSSGKTLYSQLQSLL